MARDFDIPSFYTSSIISQIKQARADQDPRKKDLSPTLLDIGHLRFKIARHFGFCFGVQNAIEIAYRAISENPSKRIFLLSEMIHNSQVNADLKSRGVQFLLKTDGSTLIPFSDLNADDIVIVPAFGTTAELFIELESRGVNPYKYNATCPFVEKVWKRAKQLGDKNFSVIVHGKHSHEETRATFSHSSLATPTLVIRDVQEAKLLACFISGEQPMTSFDTYFKGRYSQSFSPVDSLSKIGVVNQTTMLATETLEISAILKDAITAKYGSDNATEHFADTRDTLCYATNENQDAVYGMIEQGGDLAIVVGGYNSSNTTHLVELCQRQAPTYHVKDAAELQSIKTIQHLTFPEAQLITTKDWIPNQSDQTIEILVTSGASCPDALVDEVIVKICSFFELEDQISPALQQLTNSPSSLHITQ